MKENKLSGRLRDRAAVRVKKSIALRALVLMSLLAVSSSMLSAATLTLEAVTEELRYQQTTNSPCIIGEPSCNQGAFPDATLLEAGDSSFDAMSPIYTVGFLSGFFPDGFIVGVDVNQTNVDQTLSLFEMYVAGVLVDSFESATPGGTLVPPTPGGGNGNGYADYLLTGFTPLSGFASDATVQFRAVMPLVNDGREQFFLIAATGDHPPPGADIPEPASIALTGGALMLLGLWARRKHAA
jgi:hypothetical protein